MGGVHQLRTTRDGRQWHATGQSLGRRDHVGHDAFMVAREPLAGAREAALNLVGDEDHTVLLGPLGERRQEALGRDDESALALDWFDEQRGDVVHAHLGLNHRDGSASRFGATESVAVRVAHRYAIDLGRERSKAILVGHVLRRESHREVGASVVGVVKDDDGLATRGESGDLHRVFNGFGARVEQGRGLGVVTGGETGQLFADLDVLLVRVDHEAGVGERRHLGRDGFDDLGHGVAHGCHRDARAEVQDVVAINVHEDGPGGAVDVNREALGQTGADTLMASSVQFTRAWPGKLCDELALSADCRFQ